MKPTYEPYSKSAVTVKAALIPFALAGVKAFHDTFLFSISPDLRGPLLHFLCTAAVVLIEVIFNKLIASINSWEISSRLKKIEKSIADLNELLSIDNDPKTKKIANSQLSQLKAEKISLLGQNS